MLAVYAPVVLRSCAALAGLVALWVAFTVVFMGAAGLLVIGPAATPGW